MSWKRWAFALAVVLLAPRAAQAQSETIHPALFVARDADSTLYLFGTMHVRRPGAPWGGPEAQRALAEADEFWTELEMSDSAEVRAAADIAAQGMASPEHPLSSYLDAAQRARVAAALRKLGAPADMLERLRPWYAGLILSMLPVVRAGYDPSSGVDRQIDAAADAAGKRARWFETSTQQFALFTGMSEAMQIALLMEGADGASAGIEELATMERAWERGDLAVLEAMVIDQTRTDYPDVYEALFAARNRAWTEILMREMAGHGTDFVAVGGGHLLGPDGLVALLRARGISVTRVSPEPAGSGGR